MAKLDDDGAEILDPTPVAIPVRFARPPTLEDTVKAMVRSQQWADYMANQDEESFEEADDFDVGDDYDPTSPYEQDFEVQNYREDTQSIGEDFVRFAAPKLKQAASGGDPKPSADGGGGKAGEP